MILQFETGEMRTKLIVLVCILVCAWPAIAGGPGVRTWGSPAGKIIGGLSLLNLDTASDNDSETGMPDWYRPIRQRHITAILLYTVGFATVIATGLVFVLL